MDLTLPVPRARSKQSSASSLVSALCSLAEESEIPSVAESLSSLTEDREPPSTAA